MPKTHHTQMRKQKTKTKPQTYTAGFFLIVPFAIIYALTQNVNSALYGSLGGTLTLFITWLLRKQNQNRKFKDSGIEKIDRMNGVEFEHYLVALFTKLGYKAKITTASSDYGADLILEKRRQRIVVQAKRYQKNVGLRAVQEIHGAVAHYGAQKAWVVTNSRYTKQAKILAESNHVVLIDRDDLIDLIHKSKRQ